MSNLWRSRMPTKANSDFRDFRILNGAALALSVVILQAFIGIGSPDKLISYAEIFFAISIPLSALYIFILSTLKTLRFVDALIIVPANAIGLMSCLAGVTLTFFHLSVTVGIVFLSVFTISLVIVAFIQASGDTSDRQLSDDGNEIS